MDSVLGKSKTEELSPQEKIFLLGCALASYGLAALVLVPGLSIPPFLANLEWWGIIIVAFTIGIVVLPALFFFGLIAVQVSAKIKPWQRWIIFGPFLSVFLGGI